MESSFSVLDLPAKIPGRENPEFDPDPYEPLPVLNPLDPDPYEPLPVLYPLDPPRHLDPLHCEDPLLNPLDPELYEPLLDPDPQFVCLQLEDPYPPLDPPLLYP